MSRKFLKKDRSRVVAKDNDVPSRLTPSMTMPSSNLGSEFDDGYNSDCLSVNEYIDDAEFFENSEFIKKRVISVLPVLNADGQRKRHERGEPKRGEELLTKDDEKELERIRYYFREIIDRHELIFERA
jgi:hypothetical protein